MKILLVDDDAQILRGVTRMIESEVDHWQVESAPSGADALEMLESGDFNVVVSDMRMPVMDGAQLLETVEERFPHILRIVLSGQADRETVMRAIRPMHQYLSKPCDPQRLIESIRKAEIFQETIASTEVLNAIGRANGLPSLPNVFTEINKELTSETGTSASLSRVVLKDPMLCAKILQLANSAIFGISQPIVDVERGLSVLGTEMTRALALSLAVFMPGQKSTAKLSYEMFAHGVNVAGIARRIAGWEKVDAETSNTVFSGGLLHDIGKVVLLNAFEERYVQLCRISESTSQPVFDLEMEEFGATHAGVGAYLLEMWGLPSLLIKTVASHHSLDVCARSTLSCQIVFAANWIEHCGSRTELPSEHLNETDGFLSKLRGWNERYLQEMKEDSDV